MNESNIRHAGLIALRHAGFWRGVLIEGPSGAGKSDLALRAIDAGFRLVADDRTLVWESGGRLFGRAPDSLLGLIEARGIGVIAERALPFAPIALVVRSGEPERMPERDVATYTGVTLPRLTLPLLALSAPAKLRRALDHLGAEPEGAYLPGLAAPPRPRPDRDIP
jgi:serine kinase of HPr protein (carbohydrate metabolism regulator)